MSTGELAAIDHIVVLMFENRSFDHLLGFPHADRGNVSPAGQPFDGLAGHESNEDGSGVPTVLISPLIPPEPRSAFRPRPGRTIRYKALQCRRPNTVRGRRSPRNARTTNEQRRPSLHQGASRRLESSTRTRKCELTRREPSANGGKYDASLRSLVDASKRR